MRKPNASLKFMAQAVTASRKAATARTQTLRAYYQRKAQAYLSAAAKSKDAVAAVSIIQASNKHAQITAARSRRSLRAECVGDDCDPVQADDMVDMIDVDDGLDTDVLDDDLGIIAASEDDDDADEKDDDKESDDDDDDKEVDSRVAAILSRRRRLASRRMMSARRRI